LGRFHGKMPHGASRGFTLIEVVISLGVVALGFVGVMGLLPVGLSTFKQAKANTVESQIVQGITNNILLTRFSKLSELAAKDFPYDMEGTLLPDNEASAALYTAKVTLKSVSDSSFFPVNLQSAAGDEALCVQIQITRKTEPSKVRIFSVIVANNNS